MEKKHADLLNSPEFRQMVKQRAVFCLTGAFIISLVYFGFILFIAFQKNLMSLMIGNALTISIPIGIGIILLAWIMTGIYLYWANKKYDIQVENLKKTLKTNLK
ncbi:MAG: DUF485 domain-containing protein [Bacteroidales bacterium]